MRKRTAARRLFAIYLLAFGILAFGDASIRDAAAQATANTQTHLYFFTNDGCAPCRQVEPGIEALHREGYPVTTVKLNDYPQWGARFQVDRTPTVVLIQNQRIVGRHAGLIDAVTLKRWFAAVGVNAGTKLAGSAASSPAPSKTKVVFSGQSNTSSNTTYTRGGESSFSTPTMLKGTSRSRTAAEKLAMQATVRLKVEDPEGISYATGTVIHTHGGESLVMTCGHVFRDSQGKGVITAEYGFDSGQVQTGQGQLISYDSDARDIAVVAISTSKPIQPVPIAVRKMEVKRGNDIFSIGCDHGEAPTIRHSRIKNRALYNDVVKYDIHGRPVDGRSGGGLFTPAGELIGVCNAAAVEEDEGIYTALDTIYWQLAAVKLEHLFEGQGARAIDSAIEMPVVGADSQTFASAGFSRERSAASTTTAAAPQSNSRLAQIRPRPATAAQISNVAWDRGTPQRPQSTGDADQEVIILIRSKSDPNRAQTITISQPTPQLLNYLGTMKSNVSGTRQLDIARLRQQHSKNR